MRVQGPARSGGQWAWRGQLVLNTGHVTVGGTTPVPTVTEAQTIWPVPRAWGRAQLTAAHPILVEARAPSACLGETS